MHGRAVKAVGLSPTSVINLSAGSIPAVCNYIFKKQYFNLIIFSIKTTLF